MLLSVEVIDKEPTEIQFGMCDSRCYVPKVRLVHEDLAVVLNVLQAERLHVDWMLSVVISGVSRDGKVT